VLHSRSLQNNAFHRVARAAGLHSLSWQTVRQSRNSAQHRAARAPGVRTVAFMAQPKFGKTIVQEAKGVHAATVFVMHGLGDSGEGLAHIGPSLALPHVKFICEGPYLPTSFQPGCPAQCF
jgi:Phospholipase/Carboxylesterase